MIVQVIVNFFMHSAFITMKAKTNMIVVATTDGIRTQHGRTCTVVLYLYLLNL